MKLANAFIEIFRLELRQTIRFKRVIWVALLLIVPSLIILLVSLAGNGHTSPRDFTGIGYFFFIQVFTPIISLMYGANMIGQEIDNKTLTYLLVRPVPKWLILLAKYAANVLAITALLWVFFALTMGIAVLFNSAQNWENIFPIGLMFALALFLGALIFTAIFNLLGLLTRRVLLFGVGYCLLIEWLLSNLPIVLQNLSVSYYLRHLLATYGPIKEFFTYELHVSWAEEAISLPGTFFTLVIILGIVLGASIFIFRSREFILTEQ